MARRRFRNRVGVGQAPTGVWVTPDVAQDMIRTGHLKPEQVNIQAPVTGQGIVPNFTGPSTGTPSSGISGGGGLIDLGINPTQDQIQLLQEKYRLEQQSQANENELQSGRSNQSFGQQSALSEQQHQQRMQEIAASQGDQTNPMAGLLPKYTSPSVVPTAYGGDAIFDPNTGQFIPVSDGEIKISGGNLIVPPGTSATAYYPQNGGAPTQIGGGPGLQPQQLPFSAIQQARALGPEVQAQARQNQAQAQGSTSGFGGMGGYGGGGFGGSGAAGGLGRAFGQSAGSSAGGSPMAAVASGSRTFGQPPAMSPGWSPQAAQQAVAAQPSAQPYQFPQDMVDYYIAAMQARNAFGLPQGVQ